MLGLLDGRTDKDQTVKAMTWLQDAADRGLPEAQFQLAFQYETAPAPDLRRAFQLYEKAAGHGYAGAQAQLGSMFFRGEGGVAVDPPKGLYWLKRAAEQGQPQARAILAEAVKRGVPGASDPLPDAPGK